jgi:HEAT repeat protein
MRPKINDVLRDDLIQDLLDFEETQSAAKSLQQAGIKSYTQFHRLLHNENTDPDLLAQARKAAFKLSERIIDKRRAIPLLLGALKSSDDGIKFGVLDRLGFTFSKRATEPLLALLGDKGQSRLVRDSTLRAMWHVEDKRVEAKLTEIIHDETEELQLRVNAVEWRHHLDNRFPVNEE